LLAAERLLDFREEDLRAPLRREDDFLAPRRDDLRALPELRLERFLAPPLFRPEDLDRVFLLPPFERLDLLAAAIGKLRVAGFVERIARFAHKHSNQRRVCRQHLAHW